MNARMIRTGYVGVFGACLEVLEMETKLLRAAIFVTSKQNSI